MADISLTLSNLQDTVEKASSSIKTLDSAFSEMSEVLKGHVDKVDKTTKKQEDAIKRQQQAVDKLTRSIQNNLSSITSEFTKQIPIIGKSLQNGIDSILKGMQRPLEALSRFVLGNKNLSGVLTAAGGGLLASAALIFKEFQKIENAVVSISKQTGFYGQQLKNVRDMTIEAYKGNLQFGISMEKNAKSAIGLVTALGSQRRITQDLIKFNAQLADYTGLSADQTGKLMSTMIKGFGMTTNQVKNFIGQLATATAGGQATATIIRDMAANSNLVAMHAAKGAQYLLDMSAYSRLTNVNMNKMQSMTDVFLNFDSGTELINKLNVAFGGSLNSMEMFSKAMKGDVVGVMDDLHGLLSSPQGLRTLQMYPGYARQLGQQLGMSYDEMLKIAKMTKSDLELAKQQQGEQAKINDILREQRTTFENMKNILIAEFLPGFTNLAKRAITMVKPLKEGALYVRDIYRNFREMIGGSDVAALSTIAVAIPTLISLTKVLFGRGSERNPLYVKDVSGGVGGVDGRRWQTGSSAARRGYQRGRAQGSGFFRSVGRGVSSGYQSLSRGGGMRGLLRGGAVGTILSVLSLVDAISTGDSESIIRSLLSIGGAGLGGALGAILGPAGSIAGGFAGGYAGGALADAIYGGRAATGRVVGSPSLFMVGEENRREVIIPTERIRNGMPVSSDVANELASIGVPGFFDGGGVGGFSTSVGGPGYGNRNRGSVASSGSVGEQKRREQESRSINEAYRRDLKAQHNERLEALINIERNTADTSTLLGGSGGGGLTNVNYRFPRRRGGGGLNIDPIKDMPKDFIDAFKQGFLNEYQEWRKSLVGDQRQTVELLHDLYDMYGIYGKQGMRGVYRHAATDKGVEQRLDWIISKIGGSGSIADRESMALTQGLRAGMMSDVLGGNWKQNLGVGLSTALFSSGVYRMQNALDYRNYVPQRPTVAPPRPTVGLRESSYDPKDLDFSDADLTFELDPEDLAEFAPGIAPTISTANAVTRDPLRPIQRVRMEQALENRILQKVGVANLSPTATTPNQARRADLLELEDLPQLNLNRPPDLLGLEDLPQLTQNFDRATGGRDPYADMADQANQGYLDLATTRPYTRWERISDRIKGSAVGQKFGEWKKGFGGLFEGSQQMVKDPKTGAMVPTGEKGGFFSSAAGGAALQGLGAAGLQLATGGFGRKNVGAAVSTGFSAAGSALATMGPYGMVAGLGLNIAGGLIGNAIAGSSKAVKRNKAMAGLKKAIDNKDMSTFRNKKALSKTLRQPSSRGRTLVAIQALLGGLPNPLSSRELGALTSYLINDNASETDHAFWNKRLFDKDSDKLTGDNTFENLQTQMNESGKFDNELESSADNILERWRKDRGYESEADAIEALGISPEDAKDITKLTTAISQRSGGSQFLEQHMMSMSDEEYAEAQSGGDGGGGGQVTMPPELTQYMMELNNNVRKMGQELGSQTFNVIIKMDSREVAQAVVEAQSEIAENNTTGG
jgi:hypothetical protein